MGRPHALGLSKEKLPLVCMLLGKYQCKILNKLCTAMETNFVNKGACEDMSICHELEKDQRFCCHLWSKMAS
jgi:hypothetical protein